MAEVNERFDKIKSLGKEAISFYKSVIVKGIKRIPLFVFGFFALIGTLVFGSFIGYASATLPLEGPSELELVQEDNRRLRELVDGYENISKLYYEQGVNVAVLMDMESLVNDPLKVRGAINSMNEYRDLINFQSGRIQELRRSAGYSENSEAF